MRFLRRRALDELRHAASREHAQFRASVDDEDFGGALWYSQQQEQAVRELMEHEPEDRFHRWVLAGLLYNRAAVLDAMELGESAIAAARDSLDIYKVFDPTHGAYSGVEQQLRASRATGAEVVEMVIAQTADVRARLARLLAKYEGQAAADSVHRLGMSAVKAYEALLRFGSDVTQADVDRIRAQYDAAKRHLP